MRRLRKGDEIKFNAMSELTGQELVLTGKILGDKKAVRKQWPLECGQADNCYLVKTVDNFGNDYLHVVHPEEIIEETI